MTPYTIPEFTTDRLRLRAPKLDDLPRVIDFWASERSHMVGGPRSEVEASRSLFSVYGFWALRGAGIWYIADKQTDAFLGFTGFMYGPGWEEPEIGFAMYPDAEGKGIAYEAACRVRDYAYTELGWTTLTSNIVPGNDRSAALAERMGAWFEKEYDNPHMGVDRMFRHPSPQELAQ